MKYYVYRHIRLDKNIPFYIGMGSKPSVQYASVTKEYSRAFTMLQRSLLWNKIYEKTNKIISVEILYESDDYDNIKLKEIEFIKLYGRIDLGTGTLCNLTDGGEGMRGLVFTETHKNRISESNSKYTRSPETRKKISDAIKRIGISSDQKQKAFAGRLKNFKAIIQLTKAGEFVKEWSYIAIASKALGISGAHIGRCCKGERKTIGGFRWEYKKQSID